MSAAKITSAEYIQHHLVHWQLDLTTLSIGKNSAFLVLNLDTLLISVILGILFCGFFYFIALRVKSGVPSKLQNFLEYAIEAVDQVVKEINEILERPDDLKFSEKSTIEIDEFLYVNNSREVKALSKTVHAEETRRMSHSTPAGAGAKA